MWVFKDPVFYMVAVGIIIMFAWAYYSGTQLEGCIYLDPPTNAIIVCGDGWSVRSTVA